MPSILELPDDLLASLITNFPCREPQIKSLTTVIHPRIAPCRNVVIYGTEATGKSAIVDGLLKIIHDNTPSDLSYAIVKSAECVTARHLFERTVGLVADALPDGTVRPGRCETLAALTAELSKMLKYAERDTHSRFVLVFDGIDRQRDAPPTLLPALARLSEIIPNLTTIFITTAPSPSLLRISSPPHIHFPPYTKPQYITILSRTAPAPLANSTAQETTDLWTRFVAAVHDSLTRPSARTLPRLKQCSLSLWPRFTAPVVSGTHKAREFSKLLLAARAYFQDESILEPGILRANANANAGAPLEKKRDLSTLLPPTARLLLIAAYLASHNAPRHDNTLFSTWHSGPKRRRGGGAAGTGTGRRTKHRRIARKLLGPGVFVLERMVAIYVATRREWMGGADDAKGGSLSVDGDVGMGIATLASLRLLVRVGGGAASAAVGGGGGADLDRGGRWRVNVGWEIIRGVGRSMGVEVEEWLVE